jgi:molybdate transport system substrate-binding protein
MRTSAVIAVAAKLSVLTIFAAGSAAAAEIKVLASNAVKTVLEELAPKFEKATEHKLNITFGVGAQLQANIEKGETFDLAILAASSVDTLIKQDKLTAATRANIARSSVGVAVKKGAPKPDIGATDAFKRAMLDAKSICYVEQGASGIYLKGLFERMGLAADLKPKTKLLPGSNPAANAVANGECEIGMTQISEILPYAGAELVGPLPADIQLYTVFATAVGSSAKEAEAAKALIKFLTAPEAAAALKAKGLEPG